MHRTITALLIAVLGAVPAAAVTIGGVTGHTREQWTYRTGDGTYVVTFAGDTVERIEVVPKR